MVAFVRILNKVHVPCMSHTLNLMVKRALEEPFIKLLNTLYTSYRRILESLDLREHFIQRRIRCNSGN